MSIIFPAHYSLAFHGPFELKRFTWKEISDISRSGKAKTYFSIGDEKPLIIDGIPHIARIIDFDHDRVVDVEGYGREKAGITFDLKNVLYKPIDKQAAEITLSKVSLTDPDWMYELIQQHLSTLSFPFELDSGIIPHVYRPNCYIKGNAKEIEKIDGSWQRSNQYTNYNANKFSRQLFVPVVEEYFGPPPQGYQRYSEVYQYEYYKNSGRDGRIKYKSDSSTTKVDYTTSLVFTETADPIHEGYWNIKIKGTSTQHETVGGGLLLQVEDIGTPLEETISEDLSFAFCI